MAKKIDPKFETEYVPIALDNVEVQWAKLIEPDTAFGGNAWKIDVILPPDVATAFSDGGFNVKERKDKEGNVLGKDIVTAKKEVMTSKGKNNPPAVYSPDGKPGWEAPIGNGSICNVRLVAHKWKVSKTISLYIDKIQVVKHVAYAADSGFSDVTESAPF